MRLSTSVMSRFGNARMVPWLFLAPAILLLLAVVGYPISLGLKLSLFHGDWPQ